MAQSLPWGLRSPSGRLKQVFALPQGPLSLTHSFSGMNDIPSPRIISLYWLFHAMLLQPQESHSHDFKLIATEGYLIT